MVKISAEGRGRDVREARVDLYAVLEGEAEERGLSVSLETTALQYRVSLRENHGRYTRGTYCPNLDAALAKAREASGIVQIDPEKHYVRIEAQYDLQREPAATAGQPSGASPSSFRAGRDIASIL